MPSDHPVFIVGAPHTGVPMLRDALNRHPCVHLFDESHFFDHVWDDREHLGDLSSPMSQAAAVRRVREVVGRHGSERDRALIPTVENYRRRLMERGRKYRNLLRILLQEGAEGVGAEVWGDGTPQNAFYLNQIFEWFPNARVVAQIRDPWEFLAAFKRAYQDDRLPANQRYNPLPALLLWRSYMVAFIEAMSRPWERQVLWLRHAETAADPEHVGRRLCQHARVELDAAVYPVMHPSDLCGPHELARDAGGTLPIGRERWRGALTPTELWLGERVFADLREKLGYDRPARGDDPPLRPSVRELARIGICVPQRAVEFFMEADKPFAVAKFRRVMGNLRTPGSAE